MTKPAGITLAWYFRDDSGNYRKCRWQLRIICIRNCHRHLGWL